MNENTDTEEKNSICYVVLVSNMYILCHQYVELQGSEAGVVQDFSCGKTYSRLAL